MITRSTFKSIYRLAIAVRRRGYRLSHNLVASIFDADQVPVIEITAEGPGKTFVVRINRGDYTDSLAPELAAMVIVAERCGVEPG